MFLLENSIFFPQTIQILILINCSFSYCNKGIAAGINHLHLENVIHRDLAVKKTNLFCKYFNFF